MEVKQLFIVHINHLEISEKINGTIPISNGIQLTNDPEIIKSILTPSLEQVIGIIESEALQKSKAIFFLARKSNKKDTQDLMYQNANDDLLTFLGSIAQFLNFLWLKKDHSSFSMLGYSEILRFENEGRISSNVFSNSYGGNSYLADGTHSHTIFKQNEISEILELFECIEIGSYGESKTINTFSNPKNSKLGIALSFLDIAREQSDLGMKITNYCSLLEALFSTSNGELSHRVAERTACFLEDKPEEKYELFKVIKDTYGIRSEFVHGSSIGKKRINKIRDYSNFIDEVCRRVLLKILTTNEFSRFINNKEFSKIDEYFNKLVFGME
jgi:hypothetical protein